MKELLVATRNQGKLREIRDLLKDLPLKITSLADYPGLPDIIEDGKTFRSNAIKKAATIAKLAKTLVMGEDSGLEVKALQNRPGVRSARYASNNGNNVDDKKNNAKLLGELRGVAPKNRGARYRSMIALSDGDDLIAVVSGTCPGFIAESCRGRNGFGYDPLFLIPAYNKTFGELDPAVKARISHRSRSLKKAKTVLKEYLHM